MPNIGPGVAELRIRVGREFRVLYIAKFAEGIYVLHAFEKRSQRTSQQDLAIATDRLRELMRTRRGK